MKTLQHTPATSVSNISPAKKNVLVSLVFAATVIGVVLMLYFVNSYTVTKNKHNTVDSLKTSAMQQVVGGGKADAEEGWESKPSPLRMIQFIQ